MQFYLIADNFISQLKVHKIKKLCIKCRDEAGNVLAAAIKLSKFNGDVAFVEAEAMEWGIQMAAQAGARSLMVESDSQEVVNLVNNMQGSRCEIFWVISEIQNLIKGFDHVNIQYAHRS